MTVASMVCFATLLSIILYLLINNRLSKTKLQKELSILKEQNSKDIAGLHKQLNSARSELNHAELLALVTRQSSNAVMLMNAEGDILWVNNSFTSMYEYTYEEFIAKLGNNIRKTSFNPKITERLNHCYTQKTPVTYEALNITKTGKEVWTHTSLIPLLSGTNEVIGLVTIDSNIHKRIKAGEELVQHIRSFNQKIEKIAEQLNVMVELTDVLFERIEKSQRRIDRTDQIVGYVKEISDQTKILGINASIEAHAAGQYGKSFRIIANEMVNISAITINSLKEINELIESIKRSSDKLGAEKEKSGSAIELHRTLLSELKKEMNEVEGVVNQLN
jgi:PAS domain S-box-containing protein